MPCWFLEMDSSFALLTSLEAKGGCRCTFSLLLLLPLLMGFLCALWVHRSSSCAVLTRRCLPALVVRQQERCLAGKDCICSWFLQLFIFPSPIRASDDTPVYCFKSQALV